MASHYLFKPKDELSFKEFKKKCIDLDISVRDGLHIAIINFNADDKLD